MALYVDRFQNLSGPIVLVGNGPLMSLGRKATLAWNVLERICMYVVMIVRYYHIRLSFLLAMAGRLPLRRSGVVKEALATPTD